jgi:hypothetical protein
MCIFIIFSLIFHCNDCFAQHNNRIIEKDSIVLILKANNPSKQAIRIENKSTENAQFSIKLNNLFFKNMQEIVSAIIQLEDEYKDEPIQRKTWRFMTDHIAYNLPIIQNHWQQNPMILLNSVGYDKCGNQAEILAFLWEKLGFKTRIWSLNGHMVPEVFADGHWQMFDPSNGVYYLNGQGNIASVEDIVRNLELLTKPNEKMISKSTLSNQFLFESISYSTFLGNIYGTVEDNYVYPSNYLGDTSFLDFELNLPPNAIFEFPLFVSNAAIPKYHFLESNAANARVRIPKNWNGKIKLPLVICEINGNGKVILNGKKFLADSTGLNEYLISFSEMNYVVELDGTQGVIEIIYLINGSFSKLKESNQVQLTGSNITKLDVKIETLDSTNFLSNLTDELFNQNLNDLMVLFRSNDKKTNAFLSTSFISQWNDVSNNAILFNNFLNQIGHPLQMTNEILLVKISSLSKFMNPKFATVFFEFLREPKNFIIFTSFLVTYSSDEIILLMSDLLQKNQRK